jgi:hypothetical protein
VKERWKYVFANDIVKLFEIMLIHICCFLCEFYMFSLRKSFYKIMIHKIKNFRSIHILHFKSNTIVVFKHFKFLEF